MKFDERGGVGGWSADEDVPGTHLNKLYLFIAPKNP
jgi:hypothetical protein